MAGQQKWQSERRTAPAAVEATTPPLRPAPMPRQTIDYWTPRVLVTAMLARLRERPLALQHAPVPVSADEPR